MHDNTNHVFIIADGEAEFITGGKIVDARLTVPGQTRGSGIERGVSHHLTKGDVITIPATVGGYIENRLVSHYAVSFQTN